MGVLELNGGQERDSNGIEFGDFTGVDGGSVMMSSHLGLGVLLDLGLIDCGGSLGL